MSIFFMEGMNSVFQTHSLFLPHGIIVTASKYNCLCVMMLLWVWCDQYSKLPKQDGIMGTHEENTYYSYVAWYS
jgi:hypothetical protein